MTKTSLYRHYDKDGILLYVGISLSALNRLGQHAEHSGWFWSIARVSIEHFDSREDALKAERLAIQKEKPAHNVHHKHSIEKARREEQQALFAIAKARHDLTAHVVRVRPVYGIRSAAEALGVSTRLVHHWIRQNQIGHFTMPNASGTPVIFISGWQLLEHIEHHIERGVIPSPPRAMGGNLQRSPDHGQEARQGR